MTLKWVWAVRDTVNQNAEIQVCVTVAEQGFADTDPLQVRMGTPPSSISDQTKYDAATSVVGDLVLSRTKYRPICSITISAKVEYRPIISVMCDLTIHTPYTNAV